MAPFVLPPDAQMPSTFDTEGGGELDTPVRMTWFTAPARWTTQGEWSRLSWDEAVKRVASAELWPGGGSIGHARDRLPGWSFAHYRSDSRVPGPGEPPEETGFDRVGEVWGLVLEYLDDSTISREEIQRRWGRWRYLAYTTAFHGSPMEDQPAGPRWRLLLPLAEPVSAQQARDLASWARHPRRRAGIISPLSEDPTRWVAVPALAPGGYEWVAGTGDWLDPTECLAELHEWHEVDRRDRASVVLAGTSLEEIVAHVAEHPDGTLPWPKGFHPGTSLLPGQLVAVVSEVPGMRRTFGLLLSRTAGEGRLPVLHVTTAASIEESLARILGLGEPRLTWRALADGLRDSEELAPLARDLSRRAPDLHLVAPGLAERGLDRLLEEWQALVDATGRSGLVVLDDPVDLGPGTGTFRRAVGLPLRDLAAWRSDEGAGAAVVVVTTPTSARSLPVDLVIQVERDRIVVVDSDGVARRLALSLNPRTGELVATG